MADREFNIPTGPDRTSEIDLKPIDFGDAPTAPSANTAPTVRDSFAEPAPAPKLRTSAASNRGEGTSEAVENSDYEPGGLSEEEANSQGLDDVQISFLALKDSIGQGRELKARERDLEALREQLEKSRDELEDRENILVNYQTLVAEQDAIINESTYQRENLKAELATVAARSEETETALANMRNYHATQLQPYETELGRAHATADQAKNDERNRKSELNAAETELRRAEDESAVAVAMAKQKQISAAYEEARARSEVAKDALDQAQQAYDELRDQFLQAEEPLERSVDDLEARNAELKDEIARLSDVIAEARKRRQYCDAVYQFPEETQKLRNEVAEDERDEVEMIEQNKVLRNQLSLSKAKAKKAKIAIAIVIAVIIVAIIAFVVVQANPV